ncbi:MAG: translational GTPase TypA [Bacilli bacterium]|nr:translational GTPase TypA [Bacilli bacterium]
MNKIINIAIIAHVDSGKSTLVDAMLKQSGIFRENEEVLEQVMDSNDLERERGITIYSKNCSIKYKDLKINIVDTPGHADFSSEVERIIKTVDTVILLVDSSEGPMPQTRVVLEKALEVGIKPILFINKIDKKDARIKEVVDMSFDLFLSLEATDEQLDFPIFFGVAKTGIAKKSMDDESNNLNPLFEYLYNKVEPFKGNEKDPLQIQISSLAYDDYLGLLTIGRISKGIIKQGETVVLCNKDYCKNYKISKLFINEGIKKVEVKEAQYGDIVIVAGISEASIGDTICSIDNIDPMEKIMIEEPTLSVNFLVNSSPFVGRSGKFLTIRHIKDRLEKEIKTNVGLRIEPLSKNEGYKVSGKGELHISILLETMRREGYELSVSKPEVILKEKDGILYEPFERVYITVLDTYSGTIIGALNERKGLLQTIQSNGEYAKIEYIAPTRGLLGYRNIFINSTRGEGTMFRSFLEYRPYVGNITSRKNGVLVSMENGKTMGYSLWNLGDRGTLCVGPSEEVYVGMIIGINNRMEDLNVNPNKNKQLTNTRSSSSDDAIVLPPKKIFTLEEALDFIEDDELIEITPTAIRLRKKELDPKNRYRKN